MLETLDKSLREWNKTYDERIKLQHAYLVAAVLVLVAGGLVGLVNYDLGQSCLFIAIALGLAYVANSVMWALMQAFVASRLTVKKPTTKR